MDEPMIIGELAEEQVEAAVALWAAAGLTRPWNDPMADLRRATAGPSSTVLAGVVDDELVATVMVGHDGHRGWVYYLAVAPGRGRRGLGTDMMAAAEAWLRRRDVPKLNLMVRHDNAAALGFYDRLGYQPDAVSVLARRLDG